MSESHVRLDLSLKKKKKIERDLVIAFTEEYYDAFVQEIPIQFYFEWKGLFSVLLF